jgi:hypothetical protein
MMAIFLRVVIPVSTVVLFIYALVDAIRVPDDSMYRAGNKLIWVLVIVLVPVIVGPLIYLVVGRPLSTPTRRHPPPDDII